jgi:predicted nuclease of predicted toxin-antitoxin system
MKILFDHCVDRRLRKHLSGHKIRLAKEEQLEDLKNGKLLQAAQQKFDVLLTTDKSIKYQQNLPQFDIALIVLRGIKNKASELVELIPAVLSTLETIQPGQVVYLYTAAAQQVENRRQRRKRS